MQLDVLDPETQTVKFQSDPLISFVVPVYNITPPILKRCLLSLADQDYKNMEVICVLDGPNAELQHIIEGFVSRKPEMFPLWLHHEENKGACAARNFGFENSKGEVVSFFNSDYIAKPGMVRMWIDALQNNPDCGFVYGGYEYNSSKRWFYTSKPFDSWQLDVANYIDCGFPLWRKYVVEWDNNCKSLQDWDFWIRVVKTHKIRGFYLGRDYSFIAEIPRAKGLSDDSSTHWLDRVGYIKKKNGIEQRDILVTSLGAANHGVEIAKMIGADFRDDTFDKPSDYKALYMIGFYINPQEPGLNEHARRLAIFKEKYPKAKRLVHFIGADIYKLRKFPFDSLKYLSGALRMSCDYILSENQGAHDELLEYGIPTQIVPIPSYTPNWEVKPLPESFSVAVYLVEPGRDQGQSDFDKYCYEPTLSIIRGMPDIQFTGYGYGGKDLKYPNLKHHGLIAREDWPKYVYENSCLLRLVRHDHNPMSSNEFIMAGRNVISNAYTLGAHLIDTSGKMELNEWDKFGDGFNAYNWPATKKKVIQTIRDIKYRRLVPKGGEGNPDVYLEAHKAIDIRNELSKTLDQHTYINRIKGLCLS